MWGKNKKTFFGKIKRSTFLKVKLYLSIPNVPHINQERLKVKYRLKITQKSHQGESIL